MAMWEEEHGDQDIYNLDEGREQWLTKQVPMLKKIVQMDQLWVHALALGLLDNAQAKKIQLNATNEDQVAGLCNHLQHSPVWAWHAFLRSLVLTKQQAVLRALKLDPKNYQDAPPVVAPPPSGQSLRATPTGQSEGPDTARADIWPFTKKSDIEDKPVQYMNADQVLKCKKKDKEGFTAQDKLLRRLHPSPTLLAALVKAEVITQKDMKDCQGKLLDTYKDRNNENVYKWSNSDANLILLEAMQGRGDEVFRLFCRILCQDDVAQTGLVEMVLGHTKDELGTEPGEPLKFRAPVTDEKLAAIKKKRHYEMTKHPRGRAIIFNVRDFHKSDESRRKGSEIDVDTMTALFRELYFKVDIWSNLTSKEATAMIQREQRLSGMKEGIYNAFVMVVMSHGSGNNSLFVHKGKDMNIMEDIMKPFNTENAPGLVDKPKVFFIEACRGDETHRAEGPGLSTPAGQLPSVDEPHREADFLCYFATVDGYKAYLRPKHGSVFMEKLADVFTEQGHEEHLQDMITEITWRVDNHVCSVQDQREWKNYKQVPQCITSLRKPLYFLPGHHEV